MTCQVRLLPIASGSGVSSPPPERTSRERIIVFAAVEMEKAVHLEVRETTNPGLASGEAHVAPELLETHGWSWGDVLEVRGEDRTAVVLSPHGPSSDQEVLWVRGRVTQNANLETGATAEIVRRKPRPLEWVEYHIVPGRGPALEPNVDEFGSWFLEYLSGRAVMPMDRVWIPYPDRGAQERVCLIRDVEPAPVGLVTDETELEITHPHWDPI